MMQEYFDLLASVGQPILLVTASAGGLLILGGGLFLLLSTGVHFSGFHPPDPTRFPNSSGILKRLGFGLLIPGILVVLIAVGMKWWDSGSVETLANDLRSSRAKAETLLEKIRTQELEIATLKEDLIQEQAHREKIDSQLLEAELDAAQDRQEYASDRETLQAEFADRISRLSQEVEALNTEKAQIEQASVALNNENQDLTKNNESIRDDLEAALENINKLETDLADVRKQLAKAPGNGKDDGRIEYARKTFDEIDQRAGDYLALLLYRNPDTYFGPVAAIQHIAYAISGDLSFLGQGLNYPKELSNKIDNLLENYRNYGYVDGKKRKIANTGFVYYYSFRITDIGKSFFERVFAKYQADADSADFLERLQ